MSSQESSVVDQPHPWRDESVMERLYLEQEKSTVEIADELDCSQHTVLNWLQKYNIQTRDSNRDKTHPKLKNKDWLETEYHEKGRSVRDIASSLGVSGSTVRYWFDGHEIERRPPGGGEVSDQLEDKEWLVEKYTEEMMTTYDIAELVGCSPNSVARRLESHNIEVRNRGRIQRRESDKLYYGGEWYKTREKALERDGYECQVCGMGDSEHEDEYGKGLNVHHITPIHKFDAPTDAHRLDNVITLCQEHHQKWEGIPVVPQ